MIHTNNENIVKLLAFYHMKVLKFSDSFTLHILSQIKVICLRVKTGLSPVPISALILRLLVEGTFEELHWMLESACKPTDVSCWDIWLEEFSNSLEVETEALGTCEEEADLGDIFPTSWNIGSGELGAERGERGKLSTVLIDELLKFGAVFPICAAIFWDTSCLLRFIRLSSSLRLFDISPSVRGVSLKTDGPEAVVPFSAAAAALDIRDDCGRSNPFLKEFKIRCIINIVLNMQIKSD